ncbi:MAG: hypothetical protein WC350_05910 [Candidatus Micrarchaeia archaeon]|jgi:hypothetical protein
MGDLDFLKDQKVQLVIILFGSIIGGAVLGGMITDWLHLQDFQLFGQQIVWHSVFESLSVGIMALALGTWWGGKR